MLHGIYLQRATIAVPFPAIVMLSSDRRSPRVTALRVTIFLRIGSAASSLAIGAMLAAAVAVVASAAHAEPVGSGAVTGAAVERPDQSAPAADGCAPVLVLGDVGVAAGGQFRLMGNRSNFGFHDRTADPDQPRSTIGNQRFRTWVNVHDRASCRYGGYAQLEIGHLNLGSGREFPKAFGSGGDQVGVEMRRGFLWFRPAEGALIRAGVLPWEDRFGERPTFAVPLWSISRPGTSRAPLANSAWEFSVSGITVEATASDAWHYAFGALLLDRDTTPAGGQNGSWLLTADVDRAIGSSLWGASVYYLRDDAGYSYGGFGGPQAGGGAAVQRSRDFWVGGRGHLEHGGGSTGVFLILNSGEIPALGWTHTGWSAKVATTLPAGRGAAHLQWLYATGDSGGDPHRSGEFRTIAQSVRDDLGAQAYWSLLGLTSPRGPSDVNDLGIGLQNGGRGLLTLQAGYEHPLAERWTAYLAAGWLRSDAAHPANGSTAIGTELLAEARWAMGAMMALEIGASVLLAGDYFKPDAAAPAPATLHQVYSRWQLEF